MGTPPQEPDAPGRLSIADVVETLAAEFEPDLGIQTVVQVVRRCQRELDIADGPTDQLELRARRRLKALAAIKSRDAGSKSQQHQP